MDNAIPAIIEAIFSLFVQMAPYLLFGFLISGLLYVLIPRSFIIKHLKPHKTSSIFKAAVLGVPLPLCSCGVIPVAAHLRKQGANKSATVSFLASTPSTGADSIFATYSLMGPIYTVFRPIDALFSGLLAGILVKAFNPVEDQKEKPSTHTDTSQVNQFRTATKISPVRVQAIRSSCSSENEPEASSSSCCSSEKAQEEVSLSCCSSEKEPEALESTSCCSSEKAQEEISSSSCSSEKEPEALESISCCSSEKTQEEINSSSCSSENKSEAASSSCCSSDKPAPKETSCCSSPEQIDPVTTPTIDKLKKAIHYGLFELVNDTKKWILIGIVLGGLLSWGIPSELAEYWKDYPLLSYLSMLVIGLPMYVCATASIPIATALLVNGLSPGAALVFLAVGPATNTATIAFLSSSMGKKNVFIYIFSISFSAVLLGLIIDIFYGETLTHYFQSAAHVSHIGLLDYMFSAILAGLILYQYLKKK